MFYFSVKFQVQLQEETLEEDQAGPVNTRIPASLHPNICQEVQLLGPTAGREPCYLEQQSFCTDTLVMLMFDNKRSVIKLEVKPCGIFYFPTKYSWVISIYRRCVFWRGGVSLTRLWRGGFPSLDRTANTRWKIVVISSFSRIWVWLLVPETAALFKKAKTSSETN